MTIKKPEAPNNTMAADDLLQNYLERMTLLESLMEELQGDDRQTSFNQTATFALLYIADKLDSIDTRLFHLVDWVQKWEKDHD